ncbi:Pimeloyl-ACP methyl ester carboxylesterase [Marivirga sericea]|uniref:Pimeloyl-ACP methyl ester carboxylesterase n=1 Tax=Marivirga sericea TaxID=1028 RepID=A0A1X7IB71_9BACT|nr:alpha/beta hydrolase [Marivirga sericea]SMG11426.1 Pimeloyl-ACP methyl ester carboxylesterase [Marivirga sericea]
MPLDHITFGENILHYSVKGRGATPLLAFHGFGQSKEVYDPFDELLGDEYTVYAFDIYYHGKSEWKDRNQALEKQDWEEILTSFLKKHHIENFAVVGYSMGGKFALASLELFPRRIKEFKLIAPDGIKTSLWYSLATYPTSFRKFFRAMIVRPKYFYQILKTTKKLGIVDKSLLKFANTQMNTREKRRRVYLTWVVFRHLKFDLKLIAFLINQNKIPMKMFTGKYDKIITAENMMDLLKHVKEYEHVILEAGHNTLIADTAKHLAPAP